MSKIEIESAFVEPWTRNQDQHPSWGMKTSEAHRRKNDAGEWETVARTFRTVKVSRDSGIDLTQFVKGDRVQVWGREVTEVREHDGKKYYDLVVWADRVERAETVAGASTTAPPARQDGPPAREDDPWAVEPQTAAWPTASIPADSFDGPVF